MSLPRYVVLKTFFYHNYMHYVKNGDKLEDYIRKGDTALSPLAKFEFQRAKSTDNSCYHIKCCYNNKYWTRESAENDAAIVAKAKEPKQDGWNSTLFKVHVTKTDYEICIQLTHMGNPDSSVRFNNKKEHLVAVHNYGVPGLDMVPEAYFFAIDWESLLILPKYVAFKGDNGRYLQHYYNNQHQFLQFSSDDPYQYTSLHEILSRPNGKISVKSVNLGKFWKNVSNWIMADAPDPYKTDATLFWPVKVGPNKIALRSDVGSGQFCRRSVQDCLHASADNIHKEAILEIKELVLKREVYNIRYRFDDSYIYDVHPLPILPRTYTNLSSVEATYTFDFSHTETVTRTWTTSHSDKFGGEVGMSVGVPKVASLDIKVSGEVEDRVDLGKTKEIKKTITDNRKVKVPPKTRIIATLEGYKAKCDVPFNYSRRDTLYDGRVEYTDKEDGLYSGSNLYSVHFVTKDEPIK